MSAAVQAQGTCEPGSDSDAGGCAPCSSCSIGEYPTRLCSATADMECGLCVSYLSDSFRSLTYFNSVGTLNSPGSCFESLCKTACPRGQVLVGECAGASKPVCMAAGEFQCPTALPRNAFYSGCSKCAFSCQHGFPGSDATTCTHCTEVWDCGFGVYVAGECTRTTST